jgi:hypothetical protein
LAYPTWVDSVFFHFVVAWAIAAIAHVFASVDTAARGRTPKMEADACLATGLKGIKSMNDRKPVTLAQLEAETETFFGMHWNTDVLGIQPPAWHVWREFKGSVPNYQLGGCYALFAGDDLEYIGLGASRGGGLYCDHGISRRLSSHVYRLDKERGPGWLKLRPGWESITSIHTIGFEARHSHLASALEAYLIRAFEGRSRNARR